MHFMPAMIYKKALRRKGTQPMKITGIIAEYNPFHNGHQYQFEQIRSRSETDFLVVVMSGNFVQRGEPAVYDKYIRTRAALQAGADLILELPAAFASGSAEDFAACGIALLDRLGAVGEICFGSECGDIAALSEIAAILTREPEDYREQLRRELKSGMTFPQARNLALVSWLDRHRPPRLRSAAAEQLLSAPNNILGIEYIKAVQKRDSRIKPVTIARSGQGYHDTAVDRGFASASGIRAVMKESAGSGFPGSLTGQIPAGAYACYRDAVPVFAEDLSLLLNQTLLRLDRERIPLTRYADVSAEMAARLQRRLLDFVSFPERIEQLKTRQYTYTRVSRALLHLVLGITRSEVAQYRRMDYAPYARILGFRRQSQALLAEIKKHSTIPLIAKTADAKKILSDSAYEMFLQDLYCSHVYQSLSQQKSGENPRNEYTRSIIIV